MTNLSPRREGVTAEELRVRIGKRIKAYRTALFLTQSELALKVGCGQDAISGWERGKRYPETYYMYTLAIALNVSVNDLYT